MSTPASWHSGSGCAGRRRTAAHERPGFVSVADRAKRVAIFPVKALVDVGFEILATAATAEVPRRHGVPATVVRDRGDAGATSVQEHLRRAAPLQRARS